MRAPASRLWHLAHLFVWWAALFLLWLLLAGSLDPSELMVGALFSFPCAVLAGGLRKAEVIPFYPDHVWLTKGPRVVLGTFQDTWLLTVHLFRSLRRVEHEGRFVALKRHWAPDDPDAARERAWITLGMSATPNTVVVGIDASRGRILLHQLVSGEDAQQAMEAIL